MNTPQTVAEYVVGRLAALGITHAFGVPGDYAFPLDDALEASPSITSVTSANELNAAYAADGYARVRGAGLLCTTFGVGELSALNGVMGSRAEHVPVFHLVGQPSLRIQRAGRIAHHTVGNGRFDDFAPLSGAAACACASLTPANTIAEMERVITTALRECRPAYITVPQDVALMPVEGTPPPARTLAECLTASSAPDELAAAVQAVHERLVHARTPVALLSYRLARHRLQAQAAAYLERAGMGYVTMPMDKAVLSEAHPLFIGMYLGAQSRPPVREAVERADLMLDIGGVCLSDINTSMGTARVPPEITIRLFPDHVEVGGRTYGPVWLGDMLRALAQDAVPVSPPSSRVGSEPLPMVGVPDDPVSLPAFLPRVQRFLRERDMLIVETGYSCSVLVAPMALPDGAEYHNPVLWGSIGWATPAALGASLADRSRRTVLLTGDGAHQLTATELGVMARAGGTPVVFVVNNGSYGIEEAIAVEQGHAYDDLVPWRYTDMATAMGCDAWLVARIETVGALEAALREAGAGGRGAYLEVVTGARGIPGPFPPSVLDALYAARPV